MKLKPGVKLGGLVPQMALGAMVVAEVYYGHSASCTITSANDSKHGERSLHFQGRALDFRTKDFAGDKHQLLAELKEALGENFDVVLEALGEANEHVHVEYDPKG